MSVRWISFRIRSCSCRASSRAFVAAFHVLPNGKYRLASTFVLENEPGPVALAYSPDIKPRVHFSTCWGCPGETGKILYKEPDSVSITQP